MATQSIRESFNLVTTALAQNNWQQVIHGTEDKLKQSELYQQFLTHLHAVVDKSVDETISFLHLLLRNTIQLTLQESQALLLLSPQDESIQTLSLETNGDFSTVDHDTESQLLNTSPTKSTLLDTDSANAARTVKPKENLDDHPLLLLGQEIKQRRIAQSVTLEKLHYLTLVPIYHLRALEAGKFDQLPELVYLRGFIQRIGNALGMDSDRWLANLPSPETSKTFLPSWQPIRPNNTSMHISPWHLYLGYAALMTGAVAGLLCTTQSSLHELPSGSLPQVRDNLTSDQLTTSPLLFAAHMSIATPETFP